MRFGPASAPYACNAWPRPKAKSRRPCMRKTGVFSPRSARSDERGAAKAGTLARLPA